jgi:hypothetical protein
LSNIFISYRREDSIATAGRIKDRLSREFGRERVFVDVDDIGHGQDFVDAVKAKIAASKVLLAVIGPTWIDRRDAEGKRRLDDPDDLVVLEIARGLAQPDTRVIPVLVDGAQMPKAEALPTSLKALARRNAIELRNTQFESDATRLIQAIRPVGTAPWLLVAGLVVLAVACGTYLVWPSVIPLIFGQKSEPSTRIGARAPPVDSNASFAERKRDVDAAIAQLRTALGPAEGHVNIAIRDGNRVKLGDQIVFEVASNVAGRLILVDVNAADNVTQIFPNRFVTSTAAQSIPAGVTIRVPGEGYGFSAFKAVEPVGHGQLIALIVPDSLPMDRFTVVTDQIPKGFEPVNAPTAYFAQIVDHADDAKRSVGLANWAFVIADYEIVR